VSFTDPADGSSNYVQYGSTSVANCANDLQAMQDNIEFEYPQVTTAVLTTCTTNLCNTGVNAGGAAALAKALSGASSNAVAGAAVTLAVAVAAAAM
jgi:hypothetical protein